MFPERLIEKETLRPTANGFSCGLRLPWYRALPLSCIENVEVSVDGERVERDDIGLQLDDIGPLRLSELAALTDTWWYVLDSARLTVDSAAATEAGDHEIAVEMGLYIPYLPVAGTPLVTRDRSTAHLEVQPR